MAKINVNTAAKVVPMIYAYTTPEIARHNGWTKIGYTEQGVDKRIAQQTHTADIKYIEEWRGNATFDDGSGESFKDSDFHRYLEKKMHIAREKGTEWFNITGPESKQKFFDFRSNRGILETLEGSVIEYQLRKEQEEAVESTVIYKLSHPTNGEYLWNCKPRFGKTLSVYDFMKKIGAVNVLIVTNRPAIANSWYSDYEKFVGDDEYFFVTRNGQLYGKKLVVKPEDFEQKRARYYDPNECKRIEFLSLQDLKGSLYFGGTHDKLKYIKDTAWDLLVIDEAHEGVDTYKTDVAFDQIKRNFTLHLSGTPFRALATDKFAADAIYNWTYADEQNAKRDWDGDGENPYGKLPKLNLYTYMMSEIIKDELQQGIQIDDEVEEYAFDLNEFFATNDSGKFIHDKSVDRFLDALTTQEKFPFSTDALRNELKHTFWILNRVSSAKALEKKLANHPVFKDYRVVMAAGEGELDEETASKNSFNKVSYAIKNYDKTITLSVGQLTTGVTIPEWTAVLMLCNMSSPSLYMQAAFRAQNPCLFTNGKDFFRKENAYVFDFDPARTLIVYEKFANDLSKKTNNGGGDSETRKQNIRELLNFFPVIGEDENGEMIALDAEKVLSIPRKIKSEEVVKKGFMSNFLFQNISNIFNAPKAVYDIISQFTPVAEPKSKQEPIKPSDEIKVDDDGNVVVDTAMVVGKSSDLFGEKIYETIQDTVAEAIVNVETAKKDDAVAKIQEAFVKSTVEPISNVIADNYKGEFKTSDKNKLERTLRTEAEATVTKIASNWAIEQKEIEVNRDKELQNRFVTGKTVEQIEAETQKLLSASKATFTENIKTAAEEFTKKATQTAVEQVEVKIQERKRDSIEDKVRERLRGFTRTIPSFLMAYGDDSVTLESFDSIIPDSVFLEVTSITLDQFRFLRDGGDYIDDNGNAQHYPGHLFCSVVFDDSVKEFLALRKKLANYFDESATEDIFDYIPPQKTNQIYTPKNVVQQMVDLLEKENPGCYDDPNKDFIDLYMKSGLYVAEIVKRLFRSETIKSMYPDEKERLNHIFAKQVYGLAPTEIIYNIAKNYVLGFDDEIHIEKHNLRLLDTLPLAKDGTLEEELEKLFPERS